MVEGVFGKIVHAVVLEIRRRAADVREGQLLDGEILDAPQTVGRIVNRHDCGAAADDIREVRLHGENDRFIAFDAVVEDGREWQDNCIRQRGEGDDVGQREVIHRVARRAGEAEINGKRAVRVAGAREGEFAGDGAKLVRVGNGSFNADINRFQHGDGHVVKARQLAVERGEAKNVIARRVEDKCVREARGIGDRDVIRAEIRPPIGDGRRRIRQAVVADRADERDGNSHLHTHVRPGVHDRRVIRHRPVGEG